MKNIVLFSVTAFQISNEISHILKRSFIINNLLLQLVISATVRGQ